MFGWLMCNWLVVVSHAMLLAVSVCCQTVSMWECWEIINIHPLNDHIVIAITLRSVYSSFFPLLGQNVVRVVANDLFVSHSDLHLEGGVTLQHPDCVNWMLALYLKPIILNKQPNWKDLCVCVCLSLCVYLNKYELINLNSITSVCLFKYFDVI